jgi:hypothetical protein
MYLKQLGDAVRIDIRYVKIINGKFYTVSDIYTSEEVLFNRAYCLDGDPYNTKVL